MNAFSNLRSACFTLVKNEEDIIESFVRHHAKFFSKIYLADNLSTDGTREILESLAREGLPIEIWDDFDLAHEQSRKTTAAMRRIAKKEGLEIFISLDADEFIRFTGDFDVNKTDAVFGLKRYCYIVESLELSGSNPLAEMQYRNTKPQTPKTLLNVRALGNLDTVVCGEGNHHVYAKGLRLPAASCGIEVCHFPYRGLRQYVRKVISGWQAMMLKEPGVMSQKRPIGNHWRRNYNWIVEKYPDITYDDFVHNTLGFSSALEMRSQLIRDPLPHQFGLKYSDFRRNIEPLEICVTNFSSLVDEYWRQKVGEGESVAALDIAVGKSASQSSVYRNRKNCNAGGAVSSEVMQKYGFHTELEDSPWWELDLGAISRPAMIKIYNRRDSLQVRARSISISVSKDRNNWVTLHRGCVYFGGGDADAFSVPLNGKVEFQYLKLQLHERRHFHLARVAVFE